MFARALIFLVFCFSLDAAPPKKVAVLGTGYVGLVLGACLSDMGHSVISADIDERKIANLKKGLIPIYEPGLAEIIERNASHLEFTTDVAQAIEKSDVIFIAVGTPTREDGSADITALEKVSEVIAHHLSGHKVICIRSTIPVGTTKKIKERMERVSSDFDITFCPEFLREGSAVSDFFHGDRFVIGSETDLARETIIDIFSDLKMPILHCNFETAEAIKYASNAFLAAKISFINEFAAFCQEKGADVLVVAQGMGLDKRIGPDFLRPGPGYGGSCFPKDTFAIVHQAEEIGLCLNVIEAAIRANEAQKIRMVDKLERLCGTLSGKKIAVLGLAFKANTDDIRYSPAIDIIKGIRERGGEVAAYDPLAMPNMKIVLPDIAYAASSFEAASGADAVVVVTEWDEFKKIDLSKLAIEMKKAILLDTRNLFAPSELLSSGFIYDNVGRN